MPPARPTALARPREGPGGGGPGRGVALITASRGTIAGRAAGLQPAWGKGAICSCGRVAWCRQLQGLGCTEAGTRKEGSRKRLEAGCPAPGRRVGCGGGLPLGPARPAASPARRPRFRFGRRPRRHPCRTARAWGSRYPASNRGRGAVTPTSSLLRGRREGAEKTCEEEGSAEGPGGREPAWARSCR